VADRRELPDGAFLAYYIPYEAWYCGDDPERLICVIARLKGGGCRWEFLIREVPTIGLRVEVFDDAWDAFAEVPVLFAALARGLDGAGDLAELRTLLDGMGATDVTPRTNPAEVPHA
jgi:hypothetical protein